MRVQVNCAEDAAPLGEAIPYGLVATLEVPEGSPVRLYEEVRARIQPRVRAAPPR